MRNLARTLRDALRGRVRAETVVTPYAADGRALPIPPFEMRQLVGPTDPSAFELAPGQSTFPGVPEEAYDAVLDFGCGCGRNARKLLQQATRPRRYVGIDLHRGMIEWCRTNLAPAAPAFSFHHHDVFNAGLNPGAGKPSFAPFPVEDAAFSLVVAWSVFTHLTEAQATHYLSEAARVLRPGGVFVSTWFLFDKSAFPMMQDFQNALFINDVDPTNAVIFDRRWLLRAIEDVGLALTRAEPPTVRGFHWQLAMAHRASGATSIELPEDCAPIGLVRPPLMPAGAERIGLTAGAGRPPPRT